MFWILALVGSAVILTACRQAETAPSPVVSAVISTAERSSTPKAIPTQIVAPTRTQVPPAQIPEPTRRPEPVSSAPTPTTGPTLQSTFIPTLTHAPTPNPEQTKSPTVTPAIEACRVDYPTSIVPGPSVPNEPQDGDRVFRSLTVHPSDPNIVLLGTERNSFMLSEDGGVTWTRLRAGLRSADRGYSEIWDIDYSASNPDVIMAERWIRPDRPSAPESMRGSTGARMAVSHGPS